MYKIMPILTNKAEISGSVGGILGSKQLLMDKFNQNIDDVKKGVPPEKLLVFHPKEGWAPICGFLGVPIPDTEFPNVNSKKEMQKMFAFG